MKHRREAIARILILPYLAGILYPFAEHLRFEFYPFSLECGALTLLLLLARRLNGRGALVSSGILLAGTSFAFAVALTLFERGGIQDASLLVFPPVLLVASLLLTRRQYAGFSVAAILYLVFFVVFDMNAGGGLLLSLGLVPYAIDVTLLMIGSAIVIDYLVRRFDRSIADLVDKNRALDDSRRALETRDLHAQALLRLSNSLNHAESYEEVLSIALEEIRKILGFANLAAARLTEDRSGFRLLSARGRLADSLRRQSVPDPFLRAGNALLEQIVMSKNVVVVEDAATDARMKSAADQAFRYRTIVVIPMLLLDKTLGALATGTFGDEGIRVPDEVERKFLMSIGGSVAIAINRIDLLAERYRAEAEIRKTNRTLERQLRFAGATIRLAEAINAYDIADDLLTAMSRIIGETLRVDRSLIYDISFSRQEATGLCEWIPATKPEIEPTRDTYPLSYFLGAAEYIRTEKTWIQSHADAYHPAFREDGAGDRLHKDMHIKSLLWYPFRFREDGFYAIILNQVSSSREWQKEDIDFLAAVSGQIHLALDKIALVDEHRRSEERFHMMFVNHDAVMLLLDPMTGTISDANDAAANFYGYSVEQLRAMNIADLNSLPPEDVSAERIEALHERLNYFIFPHRLANGGIRTVEVHSSPINIAGKVILFSIIHDITERTVAEEALRKLSQAIEQSPVSVVITDTGEKIEYVNPKFTEVTGYTFAEAVGKTPNILKSGLTPPETYRDLWKALSEGRPWKGEFRNRKKTGELFWEYAYLSPIKDAQGRVTHYLGIKEDTTHRKQLEEELLQSQKLQSIGTLAGGIAHDFNNLLGIIMGNTWLMQNAKGDGTEFTDRLDTIQRAVDRGAALVRQLLTFARKTESKLESVQVTDTIREIAKLLRETFPKTITIETDLPADIPAIDADPTQIHQIFLNLCLNARDAMPSGGTLRISVAMINGRDITEIFSAVAADSYIVLRIADTGTGMDVRQKQRIFEPFYTTKEPGKGTGLGLAVVHSIVTHHKGFLEVETELGKGTEFIIYLPVRSSTETSPDGTVQKKAEIPGGHETVLLIEDEESMQRIVVDMLEGKGYTVLVAGDGEDGIDLFNARQKEIDAVISDIGMPRMPGDLVFERIRAIKPDVPIVLVSGYYDPAVREKLQAAGAKYFIQKPYSSSVLLGNLRNALDRK